MFGALQKNIWTVIGGNIANFSKEVTIILKKELQKETLTMDINALKFVKYIYPQQYPPEDRFPFNIAGQADSPLMMTCDNH